MPYIKCSLSQECNEEQIEKAKTELGKHIALLPGKDESVLMLEFVHSPHMFFRGAPLKNGAYLDCRLYGEVPTDAKRSFTESVYAALGKTLGIAQDQMFMSFTHYRDWGTNGSLKSY